MSIVAPDYNVVSSISDIVDEVNVDYVDFLNHNHQNDDIDYLVEMLNEKTSLAGLTNIEWTNWDDQRGDPNEWISAMAGISNGRSVLTIILWRTNLEDKWGPITFKEIILKMLSHETIHFQQYERVGFDKLLELESGHEKGRKLKEKTGKDQDLWRSYLRDPHELMAYGHDLAEEIKLSTDPAKALRNPESFIDELPVYNQYRTIFPRNAIPIQKLMSYTARYSVSFDKENSTTVDNLNK